MVTGARDTGAHMLVLYALPRLGFNQHATGQWTALRSPARLAHAARRPPRPTRHRVRRTPHRPGCRGPAAASRSFRRSCALGGSADGGPGRVLLGHTELGA
jgi:hypothetical protein